MITSAKGLLLIRKWEGFKPKAYKDVAGYWTIGIGTLIDTVEEQYLLNRTITETEGLRLLAKDLDLYERMVNKLLTKPLTQNQFDAVMSLVYNIGIGAFMRSTLLKKLNTNPNDTRRIPRASLKQPALINYLKTKGIASLNTITYSFMVWNTAGGVFVKGLANRRLDESKHYHTIE